MARTACLVCLVSTVSVCCQKKTLEKQALVVAQNKADKPSRQIGLQSCQADKAVRPACFVLCPLLTFLFFEGDV